jgi:hypothetical protein
LEAYGIVFTWVRSTSNPYDSGDAATLHAWFDFASDQSVLVTNFLGRHFALSRHGKTAAEVKVLRACTEALFSSALSLHGCHDRAEVSHELIKICESARNHQAVSETSQGYLDSAKRLLRDFEHAGRTQSIDEALAGLETLFNRNLHNTRNRTDVPTFSAGIITKLQEEGIAPGSVVNRLDELYRGWRGRKPDEPDAGVVIKTPEMAKGDTVDAVLVHHAESVPRRTTHNPLLAELDSSSSSLAQAYVAVSRPKYVYIAASNKRLPRFHEYRLPGWEYFDMRPSSDEFLPSLYAS